MKSAQLVAILFLLFAGVAAASKPAAAQSSGGNFQPIGCYYNPSDKKLWVAAIGLTPKALDMQFYDDPAFTVIMSAGDSKFNVEGKDIIVHLMKTFDYKGAEKYKFMKYSLAVDYSSSIPVNVRTDVLNFLDRFIDKLPLAMEGQLIRFSDRVEKFAFTNSKTDIQLQLRQPITYGTTALHDALMEAATSLAQQGSNTPVRLIVLFTDGFDTASESYKDRANFITSFTSLVKAERIVVLAIGVTKDQDTDLLRSITDTSRVASGYYLPVEDFRALEPAFKQIQNMMSNTIIFRLPKLGPDHAKATISIASKSQAGNVSTLQTFNCEY